MSADASRLTSVASLKPGAAAASAPLPAAQARAAPPPRDADRATPSAVRPAGDAVACILFILGMAILWVGKLLFLPLIVAMLLSFVLAPGVRALMAVGVPRILAAMLLLGSLAGVIGVGAYELATPASAWMERLPDALTQVERKLSVFKHPVDQVNEAANQVETMTSTHGTGAQVVTVAPPSTLAAQVMTNAGQLLGGIFIAGIALFLLLATGGTILERIVALVPALRPDNDSNNLLLGTPALDSTMVLRESERLVGMFLRTTLLINTALALALGGAFWAVGLPNPMFWGVAAGILNLLPYVGPLIGIPLIGLASLVSFDTVAQALVAPLIYAAFALIEGNLVTPWIIGRRLAMSPMAIFLWMALWAWMWGAAGALIAVPMLVMAKEFCSRIDRLRGFARLVEP
jgi:predicted PurR-regulated permease PerM